MAGECRLLRTHTSFFFLSTLLWSSGQAYVAQTLPAVCCGSPDWKIFLGISPPFPTPDSTPSTAIQAINGGGRGEGKEEDEDGCCSVRGGGGIILYYKQGSFLLLLWEGGSSISLSLFPLSKQRQFGLPLFLLLRCHRSLRGIVSCCHNHQRKRGKGMLLLFLGRVERGSFLRVESWKLDGGGGGGRAAFATCCF